MKKIIVSIFVLMLLITTSVPMADSLDKNIENNNEIIVDDDCGCDNSNRFGSRFGIMKERSIYYHPEETTFKPIAIDTPDYFNWMDYEGKDWTTPAKDQNPCGSCWDFAALGALDSIINIREGRADLDVDLSEQYVLSCLPLAGNCFAGDIFWTYFFIMSNSSSGNNCNGIIPESCFPYMGIDLDGFDGYGRQHDPVLCSEKCENWEDYLIPIYDCGKWYPDGSVEDREAIKTQIMLDGPVGTYLMVTYYIHGEDNFDDWGYTHHDPDDYYSSSLQFDIVNHCVVIVGWKDDPLVDNGGYWICKNQWSSEWGYDGFFNIEYGCLNIDNSEIAWVKYNPDAVINWQPNANAGNIYYGDVGEEIIFNGSGSFDHEGEIIKYLWDFGDGYNEYGMTIIHMYESQGVYPVTLTVVDNDNNAVNDTTWAFIGRSNDPPEIPTINGPPEGKKGKVYYYNFSAVDPNGDDVFYYINWGNYIDSWIGPFASGEEITVNHTWADEATYNLRVKVKDCYGFKSDWATLKITIPKNSPFNLFGHLLSWLFERFPHAFPILKYLLKNTLDWNSEQSLFWREIV